MSKWRSMPGQMTNTTAYIHPSAQVSDNVTIGENTRIWNNAQVREGARIGRDCIIGKDVYIDFDVHIGDSVKIQNGVLVYHGVTIASGVFVGPGVIFTNDRLPRAITPEGALKGADDWEVGPIQIEYGASIGAGAVLLPDITIGRFALVGAGAVVTRDVAAQTLVVGNPARPAGTVCRSAHRMTEIRPNQFQCPQCGDTFSIVKEVQ